MRKMILMLVLLSIGIADAQSQDAIALKLSLINQDPDPAIAGEIVEVRIGIENAGGMEAKDMLVELEPAYPFSIVPGEVAVQEIGTILGYQGAYDTTNIKVVKYRVAIDKDAPGGTYDLVVSFYPRGSNAKSQKSFSIDIKNRGSAEVIHIDKTTLIPGKETSLKFIINNVGNSVLRDLTFHWENDDNVILPVGSDNTRYVKTIEIGGKAEIEYKVIADSNAVAGLYKLDLSLAYEDSFNSSGKRISTIAGVYVGGGTDFDISFSESSSGTISFSIANVGSNPADSVSVVVPEQKGWRVTGTNSAIIGNLNKGDYTVVSFKISSPFSGNQTAMPRTDASRMGRNMTTPMTTSGPLKMKIAYTDTMGNRQEVEKTITLSPQSLSSGDTAAFSMRRTNTSQGFFSKYMWYMIGSAVVIVAFVGYRRYRRKKLLNPAFKIKDIWGKRK